MFTVLRPKGKPLPVVLSSPHSGVLFPGDTGSRISKKFTENPPDTDWFVHQLYDFAPELGITLIRAENSRYVIDLNRDPKGAKLYSDGREETELVPTKSFSGEPLYAGPTPTGAEIEGRLDQYFWPYYREIENLIQGFKAKHKHVLFYDAHSIKRLVPTIRKDPFPDLILGNQNGTTAHASVIEAALTELKKGPFQVNHNDPFKGGHLTRYFGKPNDGVHALQLEMAQTVYMDDSQTRYLPERANVIREILKKTLLAAAKAVSSL